MEAWEHIAPELPPGWNVREIDDGSWVVYMATGPDIRCEFDSEPEATESSWAWFGIARKRYAELIAVERVREVAGGRFTYSESPELGHVFIVYSGVAYPSAVKFTGPTLCDAAWAVIQALGGGE